MKKILILLFTLTSLFANSQRQYDTTFTGSSAYGDFATTYYGAKVFLPAEYNENGTDSFACIVFLPGVGEFYRNISALEKNGPHDWLNDGANSWDGSIVRHGRRYPCIIISLQPGNSTNPGDANAVWGRPNYLAPKLFAILDRYRIKRGNGTNIKGAFYGMGLSQGAWAATLMTGYKRADANDTRFIKLFDAIVNVGGVVPTDSYGFETTSPARYYPFVQGGGKYWLLRNTGDGVGSWMSSWAASVNANTPGAVKGVSEPFSGGHDGWEKYFGGDGVQPYRDTYNIYEWVVGQGDTASIRYVSLDEQPSNTPPVANAGSDVAITLPLNSVTLTGSASTDADGTIVSYAWEWVSGPSFYNIASPNSVTTTVSGLASGIYTFRLTVTDNNGASHSDNVSVTVNNAPVVNYPRIFVGEYQSYLITADSSLYGIATDTHVLGMGSTVQAGYPLKKVSITNKKFITAASGLHHSLAVDENGDVWTWGWTEQGQSGNGTISADMITTPVKILTDSLGNPFTGIVRVASGWSFNAYSYNIALKSDGTLWGWGGLSGGLRGDGTDGGVRSKPVQFLIPGNRRVIDMACGENILVLCEDSTVWNWGGGGIRLQNLGKGAAPDHRIISQVTALPTGIKDVSGGGQFSYAVTSSGQIWGWGFWGEYLRGETDYSTNSPIATATNLTATLNLPSGVDKIFTNTMASYAVLKNGDFYVWGDDITGALGIGTNVILPQNFSGASTPCDWSIGPGQNLKAPTKVLPGKTIVHVSEGTAYIFYAHVTTSDGKLYATGRNKTSMLGNGVVAAVNSDINDYPDSWNVYAWQEIDPLSISAPIPTNSACNTPVPVNTAPTAEAGLPQTITLPTNQVTLSGSGTDTDGSIAAYEWTLVSGPSSPTISSSSSASTTVTGLVSGAYVFRLKVTDNQGATGYDEVTVIVNSIENNFIKFLILQQKQ